jgi:20S proteasome alpha/beta subunit
MSASITIIAALKFKGGVVIAADSQASDRVAQVRWSVEKLHRIGGYPCVVGFSGAVARSQRALTVLEAIKLHPNTFDKRDRVRDAVDRCLSPIYQQIKQANQGVRIDIFMTGLWGLVVYWAEGAPQILEYGINGDSEFHEYFHAIGSGANTAYAIYRTLGGKRLPTLDERRALPAILRIVRTCVDVEMWGVSEPLSIWIVSQDKARELSPDEIQPHLQAVAQWEERERSHLFKEM